MADLDPAVALARYARFVDRAMKRARDNGLSDRKISEKSGVSTSTMHRWRNSHIRQLPEIEKVRAFCLAAGASFDEALEALGMSDAAPTATPEGPLPHDVQIILRRLADPNTPETEREFIRLSLQMLADRAGAVRPAEQNAGPDAG